MAVPQVSLSSDGGEVKVKSKGTYRSRKWTFTDRQHFVMGVWVHVLSLLAPFHFNWNAALLAFVLYVVTGLFGITLCYHRILAHRSLRVPKLLEYIFAYCGVQALQDEPIYWVSIHRHHHRYTDSPRDPHSPIRGFLFSHFGWFFYTYYIDKRSGGLNNVADLEKQPFYRFIQKTYLLHPIALGVVLYALGGYPYLTWGMGIRTLCFWHSTFLVNSACHIWGKQTWATGDLSRNNWCVALLTFGEGWHNNHHAFEQSARQGLEWWQLDATWCVIRFLQLTGLATNVKLPTQDQKKRMTIFDNSVSDSKTN